MNAVAGYRHPSSVKARWIPAFAGMTEEGVPGRAVRTIIPAFAGMTEEGVPGCAVRTLIPAFAGMTAQTPVRHSREGGNPVIVPRNRPASSFTDYGYGRPQVRGRAGECPGRAPRIASTIGMPAPTPAPEPPQ